MVSIGDGKATNVRGVSQEHFVNDSVIQRLLNVYFFQLSGYEEIQCFSRKKKMVKRIIMRLYFSCKAGLIEKLTEKKSITSY